MLRKEHTMAQPMLTTIDNPYSPITQYDDWYAFDEAKGHCTCGLIARIARSSNNLTVDEEDYEIDNAYKEIIKEDVLGKYIIVTQ